MAFNDPIAEFLTQIRNAMMAKHRHVDCEISKMRMQIIRILKEKGYIESFLTDEKKRKMRIFLKYTKKREPILQGLKRASSPGLRRYVGYESLRPFFGGMGTMILSTSQGVVDDEKARELKVGGELLCYIW
jgi:small subunit ribosomal protein S8